VGGNKATFPFATFGGSVVPSCIQCVYLLPTEVAVHTYVHEAVDSGGVDRLKELVGQYPEVLGYVLDPAIVVMLISMLAKTAMMPQGFHFSPTAGGTIEYVSTHGLGTLECS